MKIALKIFLPMLAEVIGRDELELDFPGRTVGELLDHLARRHGPRAAKALYDGSGQLDLEVQVLVNRSTWVTRDNLGATLADGDEVRIMVLMGGG